MLILARNALAFCVILVSLAVRADGAVPPVGLETRIAPGGVFECAEVKMNGSLAPWRPYTIRGTALGYSPPCQPPSLAAILQSDFRSVLDGVKALGANTIRVYQLPPTSGPLVSLNTQFLDYCYELGLHVIVTVPSWNPMPSVSAIANDATLNAAMWKNHPALLAYCVANEFTLSPLTGGQFPSAQLKQLILQVDQVAAAIRAVDPNRVVMTSVHELPNFQFLFNTDAAIPGQTWAQHFVANAPNVGLWGVQLFRARSLHPFFFHWSQQIGTNVAWCLSEFGADSFDTPTANFAEATQANEIVRQWDEVHRMVSGPHEQSRFAGAIVTTFADEWWKNINPCVLDTTGYLTTISTAVPGSSESITYYGDHDGFRSEELLGIKSNSPSGVLFEKPSFFAVQSRFQNTALPAPDYVLSVRSRGFTVGGGLGNGFVQFLIDNNTILHNCGGCSVSMNGPGLTILRIDRSSGEIADHQLFNTLNSAGAVAATHYLSGLPAGTLLALGVADSFHLNLPLPFSPLSAHDLLVAKLASLLGTTKLTNSIPFRAGWAAIGIVGQSAPLAEATPAIGTTVQASATIELDLDSDSTPDATDLNDDGDALPDANEIAIGTDPVDPSPELYRLKLQRDPATKRVQFEIIPGHPNPDFTSVQLDYASFHIATLTPFELDLTPLFGALFQLIPTSNGGFKFESLVPFPGFAGIRLVARIDETNGTIHVVELVIP